MSKLVDISSEEFWQILFDEACVEGRQAERIESELNKICVDDKEIHVYSDAIREFSERLKDSLIHNYRHLLKTDADDFEWLTTDAVNTHIDEVVEQMLADRKKG